MLCKRVPFGVRLGAAFGRLRAVLDPLHLLANENRRSLLFGVRLEDALDERVHLLDFGSVFGNGAHVGSVAEFKFDALGRDGTGLFDSHHLDFFAERVGKGRKDGPAVGEEPGLENLVAFRVYHQVDLQARFLHVDKGEAFFVGLDLENGTPVFRGLRGLLNLQGKISTQFFTHAPKFRIFIARRRSPCTWPCLYIWRGRPQGR